MCEGWRARGDIEDDIDAFLSSNASCELLMASAEETDRPRQRGPRQRGPTRQLRQIWLGGKWIFFKLFAAERGWSNVDLAVLSLSSTVLARLGAQATNPVIESLNSHSLIVESS